MGVGQLMQGKRRLHGLDPALRIFRHVDRLFGQLQGKQGFFGNAKQPYPNGPLTVREAAASLKPT